MPAPRDPAAGLATLARWLAPPPDAPLEALLRDWAGVAGFRQAGVAFAGRLDAVADPAGCTSACLPADFVAAASAAVSAHSSGRWVAAPVRAAAISSGVLWVERDSSGPADENLVAVGGATLAHSPALAGRLGGDSARTLERLRDAGLVAGRVAHDFDNIFTGILGFADLARPLISGGPAANFVAEIGRSGQRGVDLTKRLHQFNRAGTPRPAPGSVAQALAREAPKLPRGAELHSHIPADLPAVAIDTPLLAQALGELLTNAAEAMPAGGVIQVRAEFRPLSACECELYCGEIRPGPAVVVTVCDAGPGVAASVAPRLLREPLATTKPRSRGFGLAIALRLAAAHRGGLMVGPAGAGSPGTSARLALPPASSLTPPAPTRGSSADVR